MTLRELVRKARSRPRAATTARRVRRVDEERAAEAVAAWQRPGGPVDPGFVA